MQAQVRFQTRCTDENANMTRTQPAASKQVEFAFTGAVTTCVSSGSGEEGIIKFYVGCKVALNENLHPSEFL